MENYEQKYKEALERAKYCLTTDMDNSGHWAVKHIFPELKVSETWLEKQDEKPQNKSALEAVNEEKVDSQNCVKIADNIEPKFHEDEWVVNNTTLNLCHIVKVEHGQYICDDCSFPITKENEYHLWSIQDAKDGDVLAYVTDEEDLWIMIYWSLYEHYEGHVHYHALLVNDNFSDKGTCCIYISDLKPATKEQCDTLFTKMREAGYEWDAEKKELKKIEQVSAWSEDDEYRLKETIYFLDTAKKHYASTVALDACIDWINSIKQRIKE
jgi:hypothetical protein